jgi:tetratricopeptide (TPR) repeat protein
LFRQLIRQVEDLPEGAIDPTERRRVLVIAYGRLGGALAGTDPAEAEAVLRRGLALGPVTDDPEHPGNRYQFSWTGLHVSLGRVLAATGRPSEAEEMYRRARQLKEDEVRCKPYGGAVINLLEITATLAGFHFRRGEPAVGHELIQRAIRLGAEALDRKPDDLAMRFEFGKGHLYPADAMAQAGEHAEAERLYREAARIMEGVAAKRPSEAKCRELAKAYAAHARYAAQVGHGPQAAALFRQAAAAYCEVTSLRAEDIRGHNDLAQLFATSPDPELRDPDQAVRLNERVLELCKTRLGPDDPATLWSMGNLAETYQTVGRLDQAERLLGDLSERVRRLDRPKTADTADLLAKFGKTLLALDRYAEAEPVLRECLAIRAEKLPDDWLRFNAVSMLGGALLGQKKYAEAEPLLLQGYEGMKQREATIPPGRKVRLPEAAERLVRLYEATGRPDEARAWRAKLPPAPQAGRAP